MILDFSQNNLFVVFEITEANNVALKHFSSIEMADKDKNADNCFISDIHISGDKPDNRGAKHSGESGRISLKYQKHNYYQNEYGNKLDAVFYNASNSSVELRNCRIVKFKISENNQFVEDSSYGQFFVNGVTNQSAITDIIEYLGAPSHFYAVNENEYYLDYFLSKDDLRSRITVYITPEEDCIKSIEFSKYD